MNYQKHSKQKVNIDFGKSKSSWLFDKNRDALVLDMHNSFSSFVLGYDKEFAFDIGHLDIINQKVSMCEFANDEFDQLIDVFEKYML